MANDSLHRVWSEALVPLQTRPPRFLYHYTSAVGLEGIVRSRMMFMSDAMFLNDQSEVLYGKELIASALRERAAAEHSDFWRKALELAASLISSAATSDRIFRFFVASFCVNGNQLSQRRAYGLPGSGFAIAFSSRGLRSLTAHLDETLTVALRRVEYRRDRQVALVNKAVSACMREFNGMAAEASGLGSDGRTTAIHIAMALSLFLPLFKHPVFAEEREWRTIVLTVDTQAQHHLAFRQAHGRIVPYLPVDYQVRVRNKSRLPIARVIHAPGPEPQLTKRSLRDLLVSYGFGDVPIFGSDIPLRVG